MRKTKSQAFMQGPTRSVSALLVAAFTLLLALSVQPVMAQQQKTTTPQAQPAPDAKTQAQAAIAASLLKRDSKYRIGANDVLDVRIFNKPLLSRDNVRVDGGGMIRMP